MSGKKKKGSKKKKGKKVEEVAQPPKSIFSITAGQEASLLEKFHTRTDLVYVDVKLLNWQFANFTMMLNIHTPLSTIARTIEEKHGRIHGLQLFRSPPHKSNEIKDLQQTLLQIGMTGGTKDEQHRGVIFYDFKPMTQSPLLMREPALQLVPQKKKTHDEDERKTNIMEEFSAYEQHHS